MAEAKIIDPPPAERLVQLTLTMEEAQIIRALTGFVNAKQVPSPHLDAARRVWDALHEAGVPRLSRDAFNTLPLFA